MSSSSSTTRRARAGGKPASSPRRLGRRRSLKDLTDSLDGAVDTIEAVEAEGSKRESGGAGRTSRFRAVGNISSSGNGGGTGDHASPARSLSGRPRRFSRNRSSPAMPTAGELLLGNKGAPASPSPSSSPTATPLVGDAVTVAQAEKVVAQWKSKMNKAMKLKRESTAAYIRGLTDALGVAEQFGPNSFRLMKTLLRVGDQHTLCGNFSAAEPLYRRARTIARFRLGNKHVVVAHVEHKLAQTCHHLGRLREAERLYYTALQVLESGGDAHALNVATCAYNLSQLYSVLGREKPAEEHAAKARRIRDKLLNKDHLEFSMQYNAEGTHCYRKGQLDQAHQRLRAGMEVYSHNPASRGKDTATVLLNNQACVKWMSGDMSGAKSNLSDARERAAADYLHKYILEHNHAVLLQEEGHSAKAWASINDDCMYTVNERSGEDHPVWANLAELQALRLLEEGDYAGAVELQKQALDVTMRVHGGKNHADVAVHLNALGRLHQERGYVRRALGLYKRARDVDEATVGRKHPNYFVSMHNIAVAHHHLGESAAARTAYEEAVRVGEAVFGTREHPWVSTTVAALGTLA